MQKLTIPAVVLTRITDHAREGYPNEVCGLIGGRDLLAQVSVPIPNVAPTPATNYEMDREKMVKTIMEFQAIGLEVVAIYHSHPEGAAMPSITDIALATWPDAAYLIIGFPRSDLPDVRAWQIRRGEAVEITVKIRVS